MTMKLTKVLFVATLAIGMQACKKKDKPEGAATGGTAAPGTTPAPTPTPAPPADANPDYVKILGSHAQAKPTDPVVLSFANFKVTSAAYNDPTNLEGGTATLELDLASMKSGNDMRDQHLAGADYFDVANHPKAVVTIKDVKKTGDNKYSANAAVNVHGIDATLPVSFDVIETKPEAIRVKGEATLNRKTLFKVGKSPAEGDSSSEDVTIQLQLTIPKPAA